MSTASVSFSTLSISFAPTVTELFKVLWPDDNR